MRWMIGEADRHLAPRARRYHREEWVSEHRALTSYGDFGAVTNHTSPRGEDLFTANSHLRRVRLVLGPNTTIERDVDADAREVVFEGLDAETATVRIEAVSVWPGTRWADLCIGEVVIEGEPLANGPVAEPSPPTELRGCVVTRLESFHVRPTDVVASAGRLYPAGTRVEVLARGNLTRRQIQSYRVRVVGTGDEGFTFLTPAERAVCVPSSGEPPDIDGSDD